MNQISYLLTLTEGILTFISPCILPMLPIYFIYLAGTPEKEAEDLPGKGRLIFNSIGFVTGFTLVFVALGATATTLGLYLSDHRALMQKASGFIMVIFGLNFIGILKIKFLNIEKKLHFSFDRLRFLSSIVFGLVFGLGWTPCVGVFLGSAVLLAGNSDTILQGMLLLLLYSIGLGIPFILSAVVFEKAKGIFKQIQKHNRVISIVSGILLIVAGIMIFTDSFRYFGYIGV